MAVTNTTYINLAKPDDTELAKNWASNGALHAAANDLKIENNINLTLVPYTPVLTATTSAPNMGSGVGPPAGGAIGQYQNLNGFIMGNFSCNFVDPGVAVGSGEYAISLPFVVDNTFHTVGTTFNDSTGSLSCIGEGYICDISAVAASGSVALDVVTVAGVSYARMVTEAFTAPAKTAKVFRDSMPFAVATGDCLNGHFVYKKT